MVKQRVAFRALSVTACLTFSLSSVPSWKSWLYRFGKWVDPCFNTARIECENTEKSQRDEILKASRKPLATVPVENKQQKNTRNK